MGWVRMVRTTRSFTCLYHCPFGGHLSHVARGGPRGRRKVHMNKQTLAAFVAVVVSLFTIVVPVSAFAQGQPTETLEQCQAERDIMKKDPHCAGLLPGGTPTPVIPPKPETYKLLCQEGTTGQSGIHWENGDETHVGGNHCTCAASPDPVVRVTGDFAGNGRVEVCLADLRARLGKVEGDVANHTTIITDIKNHQVLDENAIAALGLDIDAIKAKLAELDQRVGALEANDKRQDDDINALKRKTSLINGYGGAELKLHGRNGFAIGGKAVGGFLLWPSAHVGLNLEGSVGAMYELNDPEIGSPIIPLELKIGPALRFGPIALSLDFVVEQWNRIPHEKGGFEGNSLGWGVGGGVNFFAKVTPFMAFKADVTIEGGDVAGAINGRTFLGPMPQGGGSLGLVFGNLDF